MSTKLTQRLLLITCLTAGSGWLAAQAQPAQGFLKAKEFLNIGGTAVADLTGSPKFPNNPDVVAYPTYFEWPQASPPDINTPPPGDVKDNYGVQLVGYFHPPTNGDYTFYICADDNAQLWLSTDDSPANKKLIAIEPQWNSQRDYMGTDRRNADNPENNSQTWTGTQWPTRDTLNGGARITLQAGRRYYIEALMKEGGGGDNLSVSLDGTLPIAGTLLSPADLGTAPTILGQPRDAYVYAGSPATFSVSVDVPPPATLTSIQWQKNGTAIPGASGTTVSFTTTVADDGAKVKAIINTSAGTLTSDEATLSVAQLTGEFAVGVVKFEAFTGIGGTAVQNLLDAEKYQNNQPDDVRLIAGIDTPNGYGDNYGARVTGFIIPPETGQYRFFIRSDDASQLFLSSNETPPDPALSFPVCEETGCCNAFTEPDSPRTSEPISLVAGRRYAFVALMKEGGGDDYLQVAARREGDTTPAASLKPLSGAWVGANAKPNIGTPVITRQPQGLPQLIEGRDGVLSLEASVTPAAFNFPALIQWYRNGVAIPGATAPSLLLANANAAQSGTYTAVVSAPSGQSVTSQEAVVNVVPDTFPPELVGVGSLRKGSAIEIGVGFDEAVDETTASALANYSLSKGTVTGVRYQRYAHEGTATKMVLGTTGPFRGTAVVLTTSGLAPGDDVTVTVRNVQDLKGNAIPAAGVSRTTKVTSKMHWAAMGGTDYLEGASSNPGGIVENPQLWPDDAIAYSEADFDLISGGTANWNNYDESTFVYEEITGDFDKVVRVEYQDPTSQWARAGMCATPSADEGITRAEVEGGYQMERRYFLRANPAVQWNGSTGNNANEAIWRLTKGGNYGGTSAGTPAYPNAWLRMKRTGQTFQGYYSADGKNWTAYGSVTFTAEPMPDRLLVGLYYSPEMNNNGTGPGIGHSTLARFRQYGDFKATEDPGMMTIGRMGDNVTVSWEGDGVLQSADSVTGPWTDIGPGKPYTTAPTGTAKFYRVQGQ